MNQTLTPRQIEILQLLALKPAGLSIDELASAMSISRPAVRQHLSALSSKDLIEHGESRATGGRPGQRFVLGAKGRERFPRQYGWFAGLLLGALKRRSGKEDLKALLRELARDVAAGLHEGIPGAGFDARLAATGRMLNSLGYQATVGDAELSATNCVYHHLAAEFPEVCEFDLELLRRLIGQEVVHESCMVKGAGACRFLFGQPPGQVS